MIRATILAAAVIAAGASAPAWADGPAPCARDGLPGRDCSADRDVSRAARDDDRLLGARGADARAGEEVRLSDGFLAGMAGGVGASAACCCDDDVRVVVRRVRGHGARRGAGRRGGRRGRR